MRGGKRGRGELILRFGKERRGEEELIEQGPGREVNNDC